MSLSGQSSRFCDPCFCVRYPPTFDHAAGSQDVCQDSQQAHADRWRRLPPRSPPGTRLTGRSRPERTAHHGIKKRAPAHSRRSFKRKNGRFWRAQFCTEVARSERFELPTLGIEIRCSIQLSYERVFVGLPDQEAKSNIRPGPSECRNFEIEVCNAIRSRDGGRPVRCRSPHLECKNCSTDRHNRRRCRVQVPGRNCASS